MAALVGLCPLLLALPACNGDGPPPSTQRAAQVAAEPGVLVVCGSGAMTPLATALASAFAGRAPRVVVEPSIGSGGAVRAAADGAIDLGLVARPLRGDEWRLGLEVMAVARDAVVIAAHPAVSVDGLSRGELRALYAEQRSSFADGSSARLLLRDAQESANEALERVFPELRALRVTAYQRRRLRVLYHDDVMNEAIASTTGALGVTSLGGALTSRPALKVLAIDGVNANLDTLASGRWAATRNLALVLRPDRRDRAQPFLDFLTSPVGRAVTRAAGYLPAGDEED